MKRIFVPCSGQSGCGVLATPRKNDWAIRRTDGPPWWRATDKAGRMRTFKNYESAERAALKMESIPAHTGIYLEGGNGIGEKGRDPL